MDMRCECPESCFDGCKYMYQGCCLFESLDKYEELKMLCREIADEIENATEEIDIIMAIAKLRKAGEE